MRAVLRRDLRRPRHGARKREPILMDMDALAVLAAKEKALWEIVAWLKGKGLWEECNRELQIVSESHSKKGGK